MSERNVVTSEWVTAHSVGFILLWLQSGSQPCNAALWVGPWQMHSIQIWQPWSGALRPLTFSWGQYETSSVKKRVLVSLARCRALERDKIDGAKFWRVTSRDDEIRYFWNQVGPYGPYLLCSCPAFCLWKYFSQRGNLITDMRKCRSKEKQSDRIKQ